MLISRHKLFYVALLLTSLSAMAATLESVRFGSHQGFDRIVCELNAPVKYSIQETTDGAIELWLTGVSVPEPFALPKLPPQIKLLTSVEAFRENGTDIVLEIRAAAPLAAVPMELTGATWRLALDLSIRGQSTQVEVPVIAESTATAKPTAPHKEAKAKQPEYVPGDRPIETKFADNHVDKAAPQKTEPVREFAPAPELPIATADSIKALEVLADFYSLQGDDKSAGELDVLHQQRVADTMRPDTVVQTSEADTPHSASLPWLYLSAAFILGLAAGIVAPRLRSLLKFKLPKISLPKLPKKQKADKAQEIEKDMDSLDRAVAAEKQAKPKREPKPIPAALKPEPEPEPEPVFPDSEPAVEAVMKESLMDRRVKRVLELNSENRSLAEIAQELDMGQDEVKLILDLNS